MARTQKGQKLYICATGATPTAKPDDLNAAAFAALSWVEIKQVGSVGEMGTAENVLSYDTLDTSVSQKGKGIANAGDPDIEVARDYNDNGQKALRAAALTPFYYAFKREMTDAPSAGFTNTIVYSRGLVTGPKRPGGRNEDFDLEVFTLGLVQREIVVDPVAI